MPRSRRETPLAGRPTWRLSAGMSLVQPLTAVHLAPTLALAALAFPYDGGFQWAFPLCATAPDELAPVRRAAGLRFAQQWIVPGGVGGVAGTFGLYVAHDAWSERERFALLNWFCVHPHHRGQGLGRRLWQATLAEAAALGAERLIFYSTDEPEHLAADRLYVAAGCRRRIGPLLPEGEGHLTLFDVAVGAGNSPVDAAMTARIDAALLRQVALDCDPALRELADAARPQTTEPIAA